MIRKDTWFMSEKIFRGFWRYRYLSWILSAAHQSHTSIFNGLTLHLSPESKSDPLLFRKVLILEVKTFSVLQEVTGKPVLRQFPSLLDAAAVLAASASFLRVPSCSFLFLLVPSCSFCQLDTLCRDPLLLWALNLVSQPAQWVLIQKEGGPQVRHWWAKARDAQAWLPSGLLVLPWWWPTASFHCPLACVRSRADTTELSMENQHSLSWKSCETTFRGEQSRSQSTCFTGNFIFSICLCSEKTAIMPPNWNISVKFIWTNWNVSFGFQLSAQPNIVYILQWKRQFQIDKGGSWALRFSPSFYPLFSSLKRVAVGMFLVCKGAHSC